MTRAAAVPRGFIKSAAAQAALRNAGTMLGQTLELVSAAAQPGATGLELDALARRTIESLGGEPAFHGFEGFPHTICVSVNAAIVHGLPTARPFALGDLVGLDIGVRYQGWNTDAAVTVPVGAISAADQQLLAATHDALVAGIRSVRPGVQLGDVQAAIQRVIDERGYGLVRTLMGHGIGRSVHEPPGIPNFGQPGTGIRLQPGMVFCLEPMLTTGSGAVRTDRDGWTVVSVEGGQTAHQEHTVLVTKDGFEVLSAQPGETF